MTGNVDDVHDDRPSLCIKSQERNSEACTGNESLQREADPHVVGSSDNLVKETDKTSAETPLFGPLYGENLVDKS